MSERELLQTNEKLSIGEIVTTSMSEHEHIWDGPEETVEFPVGGSATSKTCSVCDISEIDAAYEESK